MYKTILVPLDGSELAEAILPHVEELATIAGSTVIFLQVLELPHLVALPKADIYDALPQMTPAEVSQHEAEVVVTILRAARQEDARLIAMASHGRGGLADVYYGSVAAGVLQRIDRPLLIVRAQ